jgi:hypothetical protein
LRANLEELLSAGDGRFPRGIQLVPPALDVDQHPVAEVIGVNTCGVHRVHHAGMEYSEVDRFTGRQLGVSVENLGMPISGPAFVENLRLELRVKIV